MLDLGRMHRLLVSENNKSDKKGTTLSHALLFSLEYHMNEIEKNKYKSIKNIFRSLGLK
jgi:DNA mismatch repair protein MutL